MSRAENFEKIPEAREQFILEGMMSHAPFPNFLGMRFEEVRLDYGRISLPFRPEFNQPAGMIHGGVIASLIDTVVVGPLLSALDAPPRKLLTIDLHVHYFDAGIEEDLVAEGWGEATWAEHRVRGCGGRNRFREASCGRQHGVPHRAVGGVCRRSHARGAP